MALITGGTASTTQLNGLVYYYGLDGSDPTDAAAVRAAIKNDQISTFPIFPGAFEQGILYVPNRGVLRILPGDVVLVDSTGWPILVSKAAIAANVDWVIS